MSTPITLKIPTAPDGSLRRCAECAGSNKTCDFCEKKNVRINRIMYACPDFETPEQRKKILSKQELLKRAKKERMLNYILTAMCNCASATQQFLLDFCAFFEDTKAESNWRFQRAKAANDILKSGEKMASLHAQFFQSDMNKVFTDHGKKKFDVESCDNHTKDAQEVCRLLMLYIDRCWGDEDAANKVIACLEGLPTGHIFEEEDIERFRMR
jgi:hypothetical protein